MPLTPKAFELLIVLVQKCGRVVGKDELMHELWPDSFVEEGNLTQHVFALRKALGENHKEPQFIETVARRGYRFRAAVTQVAETDLPPDANLTVLGTTEKKEIEVASEVPDSGRGTTTESGSLATQPSSEPSTKDLIKDIRRKRGAIALAILIITGLGIYFGLHSFAGQSEPIVKESAPFESMKITRLTTAGKASEAAISRDGKYVVHVGEHQEHNTFSDCYHYNR